MENGVCIPFGIPSGVMPKNKESLNMKILWSCEQSFNYFGTQWKGMTIQLFLAFRSSARVSILHKKFNTLNFNYSDSWITALWENQ